MEQITSVIMLNDVMGIKLDKNAINIPITVNGMPIGYIKNVDSNFIYGAIFNRGLVLEFSDGGYPLELGVRYDGD